MNWWLDELPYPGPRVQPGLVHMDLAGGASLVYTVDPESGMAEVIGTLSTMSYTPEVETFIRERHFPPSQSNLFTLGAIECLTRFSTFPGTSQPGASASFSTGVTAAGVPNG